MEKDLLNAFRKILKEELSPIKVQIEENTNILKSLEHSSEVHKAEMDNINHALAKIEGELKNLREDVCNVEVITASNWRDIAKLKAVK